MEDQGEVVQLQESAEDCEMDLIRGKDLRHFIEYKKRYFAMRTIEIESNSTNASIVTEGDQQPQEIKDLLEEYADVFQQPISLPPVRTCDHESPMKPGT